MKSKPPAKKIKLNGNDNMVKTKYHEHGQSLQMPEV